MSMQPLTKRQRDVLRFLVAYMKRESIAPTFGEISEACGRIGVATTHEHLKRLEGKGWIRRMYRQSRGITVLHDPDHPDVCPSCQRPFAESTT